MRTLINMSIVGVIALVALGAMWRSWRRRSSEQSEAMPEPLRVAPGESTVVVAAVEGSYISTTRAGDWLDRVMAHGLGLPSPLSLTVRADGVLLERGSGGDVFIPADRLLGVSLSAGQVGKVVGKDGAVVITWQLDPDDTRGVDTAMRLRHPADRVLVTEAVSGLIGTVTTPQEAK